MKAFLVTTGRENHCCSELTRCVLVEDKTPPDPPLFSSPRFLKGVWKTVFFYEGKTAISKFPMMQAGFNKKGETQKEGMKTRVVPKGTRMDNSSSTI